MLYKNRNNRLRVFFILICFLLIPTIAFCEPLGQDSPAGEHLTNFIKRFYRDLENGRFDKIENYFSEIKENEINRILLSFKKYKADKFKILQMEIEESNHEDSCWVVKAIIEENYRSTPGKVLNSERIFRIRDCASGWYGWAIIYISEPALR